LAVEKSPSQEPGSAVAAAIVTFRVPNAEYRTLDIRLDYLLRPTSQGTDPKRQSAFDLTKNAVKSP
jgi:hypothetical protein